MILYHGSNIEIKEIDLSKSKPYKDFGKGFYLSDNKEQASKMADFKVSLFQGDPIVSLFQFDYEKLKNSELKIKLFEEYSLDWLEFILANRTGSPVQKYDFVYGPIADDNVGLQLQKFNDGAIDKTELLHRLKYIKGITFQYFFGSEDSIKFLKKL